jgi:hypothetical protein
LKFSKWVLLSLFVVVFCVYVYTFFSHGGVFGRSSIAITFSTLFFSFGLVVVSLIFSKNNLQILQNILLGTITLPFIYHLPLIYHLPFIEIGITERNYGGFIIETAFILLYLITLFSVFYERKRA